MELEEAKKLLDLCDRSECRDHAFGDREVFWSFGGVEVAGAYMGSSDKTVWINEYVPNAEPTWHIPLLESFSGKKAETLVQCGKLKHVERNDMQGEDIPRYQGA